MVLGGGIRIIIAYSFMNLSHYDTESYKLIGTLTLDHQSLYPSYAYYHYPYLPGFHYVEALAVYLTAFKIPLMMSLKIFFSTFDVGMIYVLYLLSGKNIQIAYLYATSPAIIFLTAAHGQLESVPLFFLFLSIYYLRKNMPTPSAVSLGFAVLGKVWPIMLLPIFVKYAKNRHVYLFTILLPVISILLYAVLYHTSVWDIIHPSLSYRGGYGTWGAGVIISKILPPLPGYNTILYKSIINVTIIILMLYVFFQRKTTILRDVYVFMLLCMILLISGANPIWFLPLILLQKPRFWIIWMHALNIYWVLFIGYEIATNAGIRMDWFFLTFLFSMALLIWIITLIVYIFDRKNLSMNDR
jgi:hypothetical protein